MRNRIIISAFSALALLFATVINGPGCANIVPPQGGPRDTIPPVLIKSNPGDSARNFTGNKIVFTFDEFVDVQDVQGNLLVSPMARINPVVDFKLREITVKLKDSLEANTTYTLDFGKAVKDITEGNIMKNFRYTFSTGPYIDSLELEGSVIMAETAKPDSTMIVMLHSSKDDSAVVKEKPKYIARLDGKGRFHFKNLPGKTFYLYALKDEGGMRRYMNEKQAFAFADKPVDLLAKNEPITLYAYAKKEPAPAMPTDLGIGSSKPKPGTAADKRLKFQSNLLNNQQDLLGDLALNFETPLKRFDSTGLRLYTDSTYQPVTELSMKTDSLASSITIQTNWKENTLYNLVLDKEFAEDSTGRKLFKTDTISFLTKKKADYGSLKIRFRKLELDKNPVVQLVNGQGAVKSFPLTATEFNLALFNPGEYELRILFDDNKNGSWDPGQFFGTKRQPEKVILIGRKVTIKANWTTDYDIDVQ
jgi:hypothetical protein